MKLKTEQFGEIEYANENVIRIAKGLFGFENLEEYLLIKTDNTLFYWLNSIEEPSVAFPMVGINVLDDTYPQVDGTEPFGIVTLDKDPLKITVNMKAPLYINQDIKTGKQKILDREKYLVNYKLFVE
ncbi:MAG: flagellar assembly protein FliW [Bacteroidetes bacterium]|nr:flagellar assembly protein FliW [Bacteroidota bacterium]MBU1115130.1 flagellar assembly protein FliW [Bacteroidota bacterium]MBU1799269.1 flagellar assembly protein FliW [Bacteroidota bacterium]